MRCLRVPVLRNFQELRRSASRTACSCNRSRVLPHTRFLYNSANDADFSSIVDHAPDIIRSGKRHGPGVIILGINLRLLFQNVQIDPTLALIPITAFALGTWQIFRLGWKTELIAKFEDRLIKPPLPLPPRIDPDAVKDFDYRKVYTSGNLRHDQEMLIGPRMHDGNDGYLVITPLERGNGGSTVLVSRGWIPKSKKAKKDRKEGLPTGQVTVEGLLREPWKKNIFTPENRPDLGQFYFPDVHQMAKITGSDAVWIEETMGINYISHIYWFTAY